MGLQEHARAASLALQVGDDLEGLFRRLGTADSPRGRIMVAYRAARRQLMNRAGNWAINDILAKLRADVADAVQAQLVEAADVGNSQADVELRIWGLPPAAGPAPDTRPAFDAIMGEVDAQLATARAVLFWGWAEPELVLGDETHAGTLSPSPVTRTAAHYLAATAAIVAAAAASSSLTAAGAGEDFKRQAIAAIDERTTDCCLRVHGQVVGMREDFRLTGTPRYADRIHHPPFHWYCRTATCLVPAADTEDDLTRQMRAAAKDELEARDRTKTTQEIHPAHARSRR